MSSGKILDIDESEVEETKNFYKLYFFVYDEYLQKFTNTISNARQDIFLFKERNGKAVWKGKVLNWFEWDKNISLDESMKQTREYSDFIGTVMDGEEYELWLGDTSEQFTDTHTQGTTVGVIILYK